MKDRIFRQRVRFLDFNFNCWRLEVDCSRGGAYHCTIWNNKQEDENMGGRGLWALRRRTNVQLTRVLSTQPRVGSGFAQSTRRAASGGGGDITDAQVKAALGDRFTAADVKSILGANAAGANATFNVSGNTISVYINNTRSGYSASLSLSRDSTGAVVFTGSSLFARGSNNTAGGAAINSFRKGLANAVQRGLVDRLVVPSAIGSAGDSRAQGSNLWARMGASAPLSRVFGSGYQSRLPESLRNAREIADLMQSSAGRRWWSENRRTFRGEIDFRQKSSAAYKVAKRFLGRGN